MIRIFADNNIVIDLLAKRTPFYESSAELFSMADQGKIIISVSALTIANTNYILTRLKSSHDAREILRKFKVLVEVISTSNKIIDLALNDLNFKDLEDGIQYYSALEADQKVIITRNVKDFKYSKLPILTAAEYIKSLQK
jgi:predicted nucleic acid-binding protein